MWTCFLVFHSIAWKWTLYEPRHDKPNKMSVRPANTQISLGIRPVWSESSLCAQWVAKDPSFLHADSEDSDQTGRMPRLIWVFTGRTLILLILSCRGSYASGFPSDPPSDPQHVLCVKYVKCMCAWNEIKTCLKLTILKAEQSITLYRSQMKWTV